MPEFKDAKDRVWRLSLDAPTIRAVRMGFNDLDLAGFDGAAYLRLADDPCLLVDVLWFLCRDQAKADAITDEDFGKSLVGDAIQRATDAMLEAIADFFPQSRRLTLRAVVARDQQLREAAIGKAMERINDPAAWEVALAAVEAAMDAVMPKTSIPSSSATSTPASAESGPTA